MQIITAEDGHFIVICSPTAALMPHWLKRNIESAKRLDGICCAAEHGCMHDDICGIERSAGQIRCEVDIVRVVDGTVKGAAQRSLQC